MNGNRGCQAVDAGRCVRVHPARATWNALDPRDSGYDEYHSHSGDGNLDLAWAHLMSSYHWYCSSLGDGLWAPLAISELQAAFELVFEAAGRPVGMAVFSRHISEGRLQCEVMAYFSPAAFEVALRHGARPCARPIRTELTLVAGSPESWAALFPEAESCVDDGADANQGD